MAQFVPAALRRLNPAATSTGTPTLEQQNRDTLVIPMDEDFEFTGNIDKAIADGYNMIILGNDMWHFQKALKELVSDAVEPVRAETT